MSLHFAPVSTRILLFLKTRSSSFETSSSSTGTSRGSISKMLTSAPNRLNMEANSTPTAPAPMIISDFGTACRFRISMFVRIESASGCSPGSMRASEPVAIRMFLVSSSCVPLSVVTSTLPGPLITPKPLIHSTLFFFIRNSTPLACFCTMPFLRSMTFGKLRVGAEMVMPSSAEWLAKLHSSAV